MSSRAKRPQRRNLAREEILKPYAVVALAEHFADSNDFETFYSRLTDDQKDLFLGVASRYLFLVKKGDWHVTVENSAPVIGYVTTSFKLAALFSLIESLSSEKYEDFYEWIRRRADAVLPIPNKTKLKSVHEEYKGAYGSIRRCAAFFERLSPARQMQLRSGFRIKRVPAASIKVVAQYLYDLRSKFVHEGEFVLEIAGIPVLSTYNKAMTMTEISMPMLCLSFEEGLLAYFHRAIEDQGQ